MINAMDTFSASLRSVGTACALAAVGIYLHRRNFIVGDGKRTLALISQQVTIPAYLFSKLVYCDQNWSHDACPNVMDNVSDVWVLLFWPLYVCMCGLLVGWAMAKLSNTPKWHMKSVLAACGFSNSTGLPITILSVVHQNFPASTTLWKVDPALYLSVYLLLYPVLQWGIGGWILADDEEDEEVGIKSKKMDESCSTISSEESSTAEQKPLVQNVDSKNYTNPYVVDDESDDIINRVPLTDTIKLVLSRFLQPPAIAASIGLLVASTSFRGLFVDLVNRADKAPLEWIFDALYRVGEAAVPLNMIILGCNLSVAAKSNSKGNMLSKETILAVVVGKLIVMPIIGISSVLILKNYFWDVPSDISGSFYLVAMVVFLTPTANNVMVMVELTGGPSAKEGIAQLIGLQYLCAPILLSVTVSMVVAIASKM